MLLLWLETSELPHNNSGPLAKKANLLSQFESEATYIDVFCGAGLVDKVCKNISNGGAFMLTFI